MPPRIIPILGRLRRDIAAPQSGYSWRNRVLDPTTTISLASLRVLHGNTACRQIVHFGGRSFSNSA